MTNAREEIASMLSESGVWSKRDALFFFSQIRKVLEENTLKSKYPLLSIYCDWIVHARLTRPHVCLYFLERITDVLVEHRSDNPQKILNAINQDVLNFTQLRSELEQLLKEIGLKHLSLLRPENCRKLFTLLMLNVLNAPVRFPEEIRKKNKVIYDRIVKKADEHKLSVVSFAVIITPSKWTKTVDGNIPAEDSKDVLGFRVNTKDGLLDGKIAIKL